MISGEKVAVAIMCAMEEESAPFMAALESAAPLDLLPAQYRGPATFFEGYLHGFRAVVATTGIGTTNAAVATTALVGSLAPDLVVVAGTAGGLGVETQLNQVMLGTSAYYHDADATTFGYKPGQIPRMPVYYEAQGSAIDALQSAAERAGISVQRGAVTSGNSFVMTDRVAHVREAFPSAIAVDMETAAIAQVCWTFGCPWVAVRAVSDMCDSGEFSDRAPHAYETSYAAVTALLQSESELPL